MNDVFHRIYEWYIIWAGSMPDEKLITIIRLTLLFAVPTAIYYWAFISQHREGFGRFVANAPLENWDLEDLYYKRGVFHI